MKIGVVTASYPRVDGEAAGSFVAAHVTALRAAGHHVDVVGAHTIASELFYGAGAPDELERGGLRTYLAAARFSTQLTVEVARRVRDWDLVIAHWLAPSALAALAAVTAQRALAAGSTHATPRPPLLAIAHGGDVHTLRRLHLLAPALYALRAGGAQLAFVSSELREIARASAPGLASWLATALVQPMGIDVERFAAVRTQRAAHTASSRREVLVVGRLVPVKGFDVAVRALAHVRAPVRLVIAGDGPERAALEQLAHARDVTFAGAVDATTRDRLLASAACVVIPSRVLPNGRSEGTPMIALEALAAGVPVIASAVGGLQELPGITRVRPDDPRALAAAIDHALADTDRTTAIDTRELARFGWPAVSAALLARAVARERPERTREQVRETMWDSAICEADDSNGRRTA